jgi:peptidoglycan/xylan/chitin deacetylase (PgdA/CDA1 family)
MSIFRRLAVLSLLLWCPRAQAGEVALTFDDLPVYGPFRSINESTALTEQLLASLKRHRFPAIGFVNEIQLEGSEKAARTGLLVRWLDAGMDLGNHGYSHLSLTSTPVQEYIADAARGETVTTELLAKRGRKEHWYRYPFLETGPTLAIRRTFEAWLAHHGYQVAPVTMENSDWEFADAYDAALARNDKTAAARVRRAYLAYTATIIPWYRAGSITLFNREIRFVFLLHASRLNADSMDALASILGHEHLRAVTLTRAMADPAYRIKDDYAGPNGDEWLTRWSTKLHKPLSYEGLPKVPADVAAAAAKAEAPPPAKTSSRR